jgi:two-component system sensor histidine kinase MprB
MNILGLFPRWPTTLRRRLTLMAVVAVGVSVVGAAVASYFALRSHLRDQADSALRAQGVLVAQRPAVAIAIRPEGAPGIGHEVLIPTRRRGVPRPPPDLVRPVPPSVLRSLPAPPPREGRPADFVQLLDSRGVPRGRNRRLARLPVGAPERAVAAGRRRQVLRDAEVGASHVRLLTQRIPGRGAIQLAQSLDSSDRVLERMRWTLGVICLVALAAAVAASRLLARPVVAPIAAVSEAAEHIEATGDLSRRVPATGDDEVGQMAARFNAMLDRLAGSQRALAESTAAQRQLVADASHELRTPVTSLRTNAEVLLEGQGLDEQERRALLEDVVAQTEELSSLVADLIELARGDVPVTTRADVRLDEVVGEAVATARRRSSGVEFVLDLRPSVVEGDPERLSRAVGNLLDNAVKYSPEGGVVEVTVADGEVAVRDHGPGIPADEAPHVFERFYRGARARGRPGSGLGLAIVKQVADSHGGTVSVEPAAGGGTVARLRLPPSPGA